MIKLKGNKGYTGIDISIAIIIILIFVPTIFGIVYNLQKTRSRTEREAIAINIATDILEIAKSLNYDEINLSDGTLKTSLDSIYTSSNYNSNIDILEEDYTYAYYTYADDENNVHYRIQVGVLKYFPESETNPSTDGLVKQVKTIVTYPIGNTTKSINISTVLKNTF